MPSAVPTPSPQPDRIGGPTTDALVGMVIEYRYSTGNHYVMTFDVDTLTFQLISGAEPHTVSLSYRARTLRERQFLVCWVVKPGVHVALIIDFARDQVHVTAMMPPNQWEFFDQGEILEVRRSGEPGAEQAARR